MKYIEVLYHIDLEKILSDYSFVVYKQDRLNIMHVYFIDSDYKRLVKIIEDFWNSNLT